MYRVGICEKEISLGSELEDKIIDIGKELDIGLEVLVWYSGEHLCSYLKSNEELDIIFLDIESSQCRGLEAAFFIRNELNHLKTSIVFTSYSQKYAIQLFRLQPLDFLLKPLSKENIREVIKVFLKYKKIRNEFFQYKAGTQYLKIAYENIIYFRSDNRKVEIVTETGLRIFYGRLKKIMELLPRNFIMIHQSYIINLNYADVYLYAQVTMRNGDILSISRGLRKYVREEMRKNIAVSH